MKKIAVLLSLLLAGLLSGCTHTFVVEPKGSAQADLSLDLSVNPPEKLPAQTNAQTEANLPFIPGVTLPATVLSRLSASWQAKYDEPLYFASSSLQPGNLYYGDYDGCLVILRKPSNYGLYTEKGLTVGNSYFFLSENTQDIVVYSDGQIMDLSSAYDAGLLNDEQIAEIARVHEERYWNRGDDVNN